MLSLLWRSVVVLFDRVRAACPSSCRTTVISMKNEKDLIREVIRIVKLYSWSGFRNIV